MAASAGERKLMAELEAMKALVEQLKSQNNVDRERHIKRERDRE